MKRLGGLRARALVLGLVPMLVMSLLLGGYLVNARMTDLESSLQSRGQALANELAALAVYGLFSGNTDSLESAVRTFLEKPDIIGILIRDADGKVLVRIDRPPADASAGERRHRFLATVRGPTATVAAEELGEPAHPAATPAPLGSVELTLMERSLSGLRHEVLRNALLIILGGILLTSLLALLLSERTVRPIIALSRAVERITGGDLSARVEERSRGELGILEKGFNQMAERVALTQEQLTAEVEQTVRDLQTTMDALEVRNIQLDLARKRALAASKAKSDFLAVISHEIRTPMNGITGFARLLARSDLDPQQRAQLNAIRESADNLLAIVNEILDFSKLESGEIRFHEEPFRLRKLVNGVVTLFSPQAEEKGLGLRQLVYDDVPDWLLGDALRIRQVLINLVNNAIKFTEHGEVVIRVMLDGEQDEDLITFSVQDTGMGIDPLRGDRLFEPFTQGDPGTDRRYGGTGLGLSISKKIVKGMQGGIGFDSTPGEGSNFWFTLPLKPVEEEPEEHSSLLNDPYDADDPDAPLADLRILVADDNAVNLELSRSLLAGHGAAIVTAGNGEEALARAAEQSFDLILMDIHMPVMNGLEAARRIRRGDGPNVDTPIVAITADVTAENQHRIFAAGMNEVLIKPVDEQKLLLTIRSFYRVELPPSDGSAPQASAEVVQDGETLPLRDEAAALRIAGGNARVVAHMFEMFLADLDKGLEDMPALLEDGEWQLLWEYNHRLLGAAAACALPRTHHCLQRLEQVIRDREAGLVHALLEALKTQAEALRTLAEDSPGGA